VEVQDWQGIRLFCWESVEGIPPIFQGSILGRLNVWLSFHPPSHNLERGSFFVTLLNGGKIGIYRGNMEHVRIKLGGRGKGSHLGVPVPTLAYILDSKMAAVTMAKVNNTTLLAVIHCSCCQLFDDFALVRPTMVASTPRLWTMLYNQYLQELHEAYVRQKNETPDSISEPTVTDSEILADTDRRDLQHFDVEEVPSDLRREVMSRYKSKLGGREKLVTTGGAPTGKLVKRFIIDCFEGMVNEGYGSTEVN
jgi:hypothetical protein